MERKSLIFNASKSFTENGCKFRIIVNVRLDDDCNNKHCDFSVTGSVYKENRREPETCGCIHEEIAKHFPMLRKYIPLHLCNYLGQPMYPVENGQYFIKNETKEKAMELLRITSEEYEALKPISDKEEKLYFKYQLFYLGIVSRWKKEADEFISFLEEKTGDKWVNPYKPEEERVMALTDEERTEVEEKIVQDYYILDSIKKRELDRRRAENEAIRDSIIEKYNDIEKKAREERDVKLYLFDNGMPIDNVIYYDHTKRVVFNWLDYKPMVTQEQFVDFVNKVDYSKLPDGITFHLGK